VIKQVNLTADKVGKRRLILS